MPKKYTLIAQRIHDDFIVRGGSGDAGTIPKVLDLMRLYGTSNATIQRALGVLERQGLVTKKSGVQTRIRKGAPLEVRVFAGRAYPVECLASIVGRGDARVSVTVEYQPDSREGIDELFTDFHSSRRLFIFLAHDYRYLVPYGSLLDFSTCEGRQELLDGQFVGLRQFNRPFFLSHSFVTHNGIINNELDGGGVDDFLDHRYWRLRQLDYNFNNRGAAAVFLYPVDDLRTLWLTLPFFLREQIVLFLKGFKEGARRVAAFDTERGRRLLELLLENHGLYKNLASLNPHPFIAGKAAFDPCIGSWYRHDMRATGNEFRHTVVPSEKVFGVTQQIVGVTGVSALASGRCAPVDIDAGWSVVKSLFDREVFTALAPRGFFPALTERFEESRGHYYDLDVAFLPVEDRPFFYYRQISATLLAALRVIMTMLLKRHIGVDEGARMLDEILNDPFYNRFD